MPESVKSNVSGVILAGGMGTRLRPISYYIQKCMIPIGSLQKPLLEYIVLLMKIHGINKVDLLVNYKHEQIVNYFNNGSRFDMKINYYIDDPSLRGSGGALYNAYKCGAFETVENIIVYYGDILSNLNLSGLLAHHCKHQADATLALSKGYQVPVGVAQLDGSKITLWEEKPTIPMLAGIGILAFKVDSLNVLNELTAEKDSVDIMGGLIPYFLDKGCHVESYTLKNFWYDVGSTEKYEKIDNGLIDKMFENIGVLKK